MDIKFHFYGNDTLVRKLVCLRLASSFSHVAIEVAGRIYEAGYTYNVRSISKAEMAVPTTTVTLEVSAAQLARAIRAAKNELGSSYDKLAMVGFFLGMKWENDKQLFCSEYAKKILECTFGHDLTQQELITPGDIYYLLKGTELAESINATRI